jgi:hypothetical protein
MYMHARTEQVSHIVTGFGYAPQAPRRDTLILEHFNNVDQILIHTITRVKQEVYDRTRMLSRDSVPQYVQFGADTFLML